MRSIIPQTTPRASKRPEISLPFALRASGIVCAISFALSLAFATSAHADTTSPRPALAKKLACSFRHPICVHRLTGVKDDDALATLRALERAWDVAVDVLELPAPDADDATGSYDVYLAPAVSGGTTTLPSRRDPIAHFDRASAFSLIDARLRGDALERAAARAVLRAILYRTSPGTDAQTAESETIALADLVVPASHDHDSTFAAHPERAVSDSWPDAPAMTQPFADGASFFYSWLDTTYAYEPGGLVRACWALTPSMTPLGAPTFRNDPSTFDVLRMTFRHANPSPQAGTPGGDLDFPQFMLDFATARALDPRMPARRDWDIDWPATPRRLAPALPIAPTGSSYVLVHRRGAPPSARLRMEATWEEHADMVWQIVKLDANGNAIAHVQVPAQHRATNAQMTIENFEGVDAVLFVVVNLGDEYAPFHPADPVSEPHSYLLTISSE